MRAETPEDWSTSSVLRATNAISSTRSFTSSPRSTVTPCSVRSVHASWSVIAEATFGSCG